MESNFWKDILRSSSFRESENTLDLLASGSIGKYFKLQTTDGSMTVIKQYILTEKLTEMKDIPIFLENTSVLGSLKCEQIVKFLGKQIGETSIYLSFEHMAGGNLQSLLSKLNGELLPESKIKSFVKQLLKGLDYLNIHLISHGHLEPKKLLLSGDEATIKITGLGKRQFLQYSEDAIDETSTKWYYVAPEYARSGKCSAKADIWSVGAILVELLSGSPPFAHCKSIAEVAKSVFELDMFKDKPKYDLSHRSKVSEAANLLLDRIFKDHSLRPTAVSLLVQPYFSEENSDQVMLQYAVDENHPGFLLIIKDSRYQRHEQISEENLRNTFEAIGFETAVLCNLKASEFIEKVTSLEDHSMFSSFIVAFLSPCRRNGIICCDDIYVHIQVILDILAPKNSPKLAGKPKLILLSKSRGTGRALEDGTQMISSYRLSNDIILCWATRKGEMAYCGSNGSIFTNAFCEAVKENCFSKNALDILRIAADRTSLEVISVYGGKLTQNPEIVSLLQKNWYFSHRRYGKLLSFQFNSNNTQAKTSVVSNAIPGDQWQAVLCASIFEGVLFEKDLLDKGNFSEVYRYTRNSATFAVKQIVLQQPLDEYSTWPADLDSLGILLRLEHPHIVKFFRVERSIQKVYLFFELMDGGNLKRHIKELQKDNNFMTEETVKEYSAQILQALNYLHSNSIVHRDVKPDNIMLSPDKVIVKLTDFSFSKQLLSSLGSMTMKGTLYYMAPEVARCENYCTKSDIWSFGATVVEMLLGDPLFAHCERETDIIEELKNIGKTKVQPDYDLTKRPGLSKSVQSFLCLMLKPFPFQRPSAFALVHNGYFNENFTRMNDKEEYSLDPRCKGRLLLINNVKYGIVNGKLADRKGSEKDAKRLLHCFKYFGFSIESCSNLTKAKMLERVLSFATEPNNQNYSSFIVIVLAHGNESGLLGIDLKALPVEEILNALSPACAPQLNGKPKIVILQACRGENANSLIVPLSNDDPNTIKHAFNNHPTSLHAILKSWEKDAQVDSVNRPSVATPSKKNDDRDKDSDLSYFSCKSDMLAAFSTCSNDGALRDRVKGSFFIVALCEVLFNNWRKQSLQDMLAEASGLTCKKVYEYFEKKYKDADKRLVQTPEYVSTLRKRFFLSTENERNAPNVPVIVLCQLKETNQHTEDSLMHYDGHFNQRIEEFKPATNDWSLIDQTTDCYENAAYALFEGSVVAAGGKLKGQVLCAAKRYNPENKRWSPFKDLLTGRQSFAMVAYNQVLYAIGGNDGANSLKSVEQYYTVFKQWKEAPPMLESRQSLCAASSEKILLVCGGFNGEKRLETTEFLSKLSITWEKAGSMHQSRAAASASYCKDHFYVFGGLNDDYKYLDSVEEYDSTTNKWTILQKVLKVPTIALAAATANQKIYVCGGYNYTDRSYYLQCYDPLTQQLTIVKSFSRVDTQQSLFSIP